MSSGPDKKLPRPQSGMNHSVLPIKFSQTTALNRVRLAAEDAERKLIKSQVVFVVDDDSSLRDSLRCMFQAYDYVVETFNSAEEFLQHFDCTKSGCLLLDVMMPDMTGLELQEELRKRGCPLPIVFLTANAHVEMAVRAMKRGAVDFLEKPYTPKDLLTRIDAALKLDRQQRRTKVDVSQFHERFALLSERERQVLECVKNGQLNRVIALEFGVSKRTVENQRASMMRKLGVKSTGELLKLLLAVYEPPAPAPAAPDVTRRAMRGDRPGSTNTRKQC